MDPLTFGLGALTGIVVDRGIDALSRRFFWSDEQKALHESYKEQQSELLREKMHERMLGIIDRKIEKAEAKLAKASENGKTAKAIGLEGKLAKLRTVRKRLDEEGPEVLAPKAEERKDYERPASEMIIDAPQTS